MHTTIYIHGTLPPNPLLTIPAIHTFFYCPPGLQPLSALDKKYHHRHLVDMLIEADPVRFSPDTFYWYGWSGKLSRKEREREAEKLFHALKDMPRPLRIITHSHGGNVALQLASVAQHEQADDFVIDEIILMACPVQRETKDFVTSSLFKTIYSIHSHHDVLQVIDPQGLYEMTTVYKEAGFQQVFTYLHKMETFFSERHFDASHQLLQIWVMVDGRDLWHIEFIVTSFFQKIPLILDRVNKEDYDQLDGDLYMNFVTT